MIMSWLFTLFSKDYCQRKIKDAFIINETIFVAGKYYLDRTVKIRLYTRKTKYVYKFTSPFLSNIDEVRYSGVLHAVITDRYGNRSEKCIELKETTYDTDSDFIEHTVKLHFP